MRRTNVNDDEQALQRDLDRSWDRAQATLADSVKRARLEASIERVRASTSPTRLTAEEFLAQTEPTKA